MHYWLVFVLAMLISALLTPLIRHFALEYRIVDIPSARRVHKIPTPRLGGVAIFFAFWLVIVSYFLFSFGALHFSSEQLLGIDKNLLGVFLGALILFFVGIYDDIKGASPWLKLCSHFLAGITLVGFGVKIWWIHNPLGGLDIVLGNWTYLLVPLWVVLIINVINWLDGIDGLASGIGLIASVVLFLLSLTNYVNQPATALLAIALAGSLVGFLPFNFNPAKIFLGDSGSMFIGFMLATFSIISGGKFATAGLVLGFPILDALWVIIRRVMNKKPIWQADRLHLHHRFLDAGFSQRKTVFFLYFISAFFGAVALLGANTAIKARALFWLFSVMIVIGAVFVLMEIKRKKE